MSRLLSALPGIAVFASSVLFASSGLSDDTKSGSKLTKGIAVPSNLGFSTNISPDAQAATIIFDNLGVTIDPAKKSAAAASNQTAIKTKVATLNIPYSTDQRSVSMTMDLRGVADVDSSASARLIACVGDKTHVVSLVKSKAEKLELKGNLKIAVAEEQFSSQMFDWQDRVEFTVQTHASKPVMQVTLFLVVEHDTDTSDAGAASLWIDSLDLEIVKPGKAAYKR